MAYYLRSSKPPPGALTLDEYRAARVGEPETAHCASPGCVRPVYVAGLCKVHNDTAWYAAGCPVVVVPRKRRPAL